MKSVKGRVARLEQQGAARRPAGSLNVRQDRHNADLVAVGGQLYDSAVLVDLAADGWQIMRMSFSDMAPIPGEKRIQLDWED